MVFAAFTLPSTVSTYFLVSLKQHVLWTSSASPVSCGLTYTIRTVQRITWLAPLSTKIQSNGIRVKPPHYAEEIICIVTEEQFLNL